MTVLPKEPSEPDRSSELDDRDELERGLRRLTDAQRAILTLHFHLGLSPTEAADALDIPVGTAKSRLHYAIEALRAAIAADERGSTAAERKEQTA
jgi:RNA polymerase sigma-70 factor (ECF subfamily)